MSENMDKWGYVTVKGCRFKVPDGTPANAHNGKEIWVDCYNFNPDFGVHHWYTELRTVQTVIGANATHRQLVILGGAFMDAEGNNTKLDYRVREVVAARSMEAYKAILGQTVAAVTPAHTAAAKRLNKAGHPAPGKHWTSRDVASHLTDPVVAAAMGT